MKELLISAVHVLNIVTYPVCYPLNYVVYHHYKTESKFVYYATYPLTMAAAVLLPYENFRADYEAGRAW